MAFRRALFVCVARCQSESLCLELDPPRNPEFSFRRIALSIFSPEFSDWRSRILLASSERVVGIEELLLFSFWTLAAIPLAMLSSCEVEHRADGFICQKLQLWNDAESEQWNRQECHRPELEVCHHYLHRDH